MLNRHTLLPLALLGLLLPSAPCLAVELHGANGAVLDFAGVLNAEPGGLRVAIKEKDTPVLVAWNKFDLEWMEKNSAALSSAHDQAVKEKSVVPLKLGVFKDVVTYEETVEKLKGMLDEKKTYSPQSIISPTTREKITFSLQGDHLTMRSTAQNSGGGQNGGGGGPGGRRGGGGGPGGRRGGGGAGGDPSAGGSPPAGGGDQPAPDLTASQITVRAALRALIRKEADPDTTVGTYAYFKLNRAVLTDFMEALAAMRKSIPTQAFDPKNSDHVALLKGIDGFLKAMDGYFSKDTAETARKDAIDKFLNTL